jgi:hypothetical protein
MPAGALPSHPLILPLLLVQQLKEVRNWSECASHHKSWPMPRPLSDPHPPGLVPCHLAWGGSLGVGAGAEGLSRGSSEKRMQVWMCLGRDPCLADYPAVDVCSWKEFLELLVSGRGEERARQWAREGGEEVWKLKDTTPCPPVALMCCKRASSPPLLLQQHRLQQQEILQPADSAVLLLHQCVAP